MLETIWGVKTSAMMDVWTIEHILSGLSIGLIVSKQNIKVFNKIGVDLKQITTKHFDLVGVLFAAFIWETLEHYLETGLAGNAVQYWFQGVEYWPNRLIFDPLMLIIGYLIVKKNPKLVVYARALSVVWLFVHIFIFPHSMYLHELF